MSTTPPAANPMVDEILKRLDLVEQRLSSLGLGPAPSGLTQPDEGGTEQWNGTQVWAHMAEFVPYWQDQLAKVISAYAGTPVPFGRTKEDPARIAAVEAGQNVPIPTLVKQVHDSIEMTRNYLASITPEQWQAIGLHARRGQMTVPEMLERFTLDHLEEHAAQLEALV